MQKIVTSFNKLNYIRKAITLPCMSAFVTIVRNDPPGSEGSVEASEHPKHAEPAQMLSTFIHLQELSEVGVHYGDGAADSGGEESQRRLQLPSSSESVQGHLTFGHVNYKLVLATLFSLF